jgi:plastocyanin
MRSYALLSLGALARLAQAATFDIDAGEHGFSYEPQSISPKVGDTVNVHFYPGPHDFTQSSFDAPCQPLAGGISSGTVPSNSGQASMMFTFNVTTTDTMWFYCGTPGHCSAGMSMVFNPP